MLEFIREKMQGVFATVIVGFFCAAFALWGVERMFSGGGGANAVATVNGEDIYEPDVAQAIKVLRQQYMKMLGGQVDANFLNDKMLRNPALESLIGRKLLESQIAEMNMKVGRQTVDQSIVRDPLFTRDGKTFDPEFYKEKLRDAGITAAAYQKQLRQQLALGHLQNGVAESAFVTDAQIQLLARLQAQKRSFDYIRFPLQQLVDTTQVNDDAVSQYYDNHPNDFLSEEKVAIEYLELNKDELAKSIPLDEAEVKAAYDAEAAAFKPVVERHAAHILVEAKEDGSQQAVLDKIRKRLQEGADFAVLAKEFSSDTGSAAQGGDVGFTSGETFVPEFEQALAALQKEGDISDPVKTEFGYHIIKLLGERQTQMTAYEKRKPDLEKQLRQGKVDGIFSEKFDKLGESTYSAGDLTSPAQELGLTVQKSAAFGKRGGAGIAAQQKVIETAFSADLIDSGKNSQVIELSAGRAVVLRVVEHQVPKVRELAEVKPTIVDKLKREQAAAVLQQKAQDLKARAQQGSALQAIAQEEKLRVVSAAAKNRTAGGDEAALLPAVFKLPKPVAGQAVVDAVQLDNGDWAVVRLTAVDEVDIATDSAEYKAASQRLSESAGNAEFSAFQQQLQRNAKITRRDDAASQAPASP